MILKRIKVNTGLAEETNCYIVQDKETLETIVMAKQHKYTPIVSHRSGETTDTFISDLAVSLNIPFMKSQSSFYIESFEFFNTFATFNLNIRIIIGLTIYPT